jgi:hypothetical protein
MANEKTTIDVIEVRDLEDGSVLKVQVDSCTELGNQSKPGLQLFYMGSFVNFEPLAAERWNYQAKKVGGGPLLLTDYSWVPGSDQFVKVYFVPGSPPHARVEVKTRSADTPVVREYPLPFAL